ncbi:MAG: hypothetical protein APF81_18195 [Desulfosporosinus sp. BRH_c37]|nr:MAG: hypothetical protein APF81_18195 [Desulfosporosinus sp. BRH_c37]
MLEQQRPKGYENKMLFLLSLVWGFIALDRLAVVYLFPMIIPELGLNNAQAGAIASILAITWAVAAWGMGHLSDRIGRKKVLVPAVFFFSIMSWLTGVVKGYGSLMLVRGLLGIGEGAVFCTSVPIIAEESTPKRRGLNLGIHQSGFSLIGLAFGAMICTQLASHLGWRPVMFIVGIPGFILAIFIGFYVKEPMSTFQKAEKIQSSKIAGESNETKPSLFAAFKYRNVWVSCIVGSLYMVWLYNFTTFSALYLTSIQGLSLPVAGSVISGLGFGGFIGVLTIGSLSDHFGRKPVITVSSLVCGAFTLWFGLAGNNPALLFGLLFVAAFFGMGAFPIFLSTTTTEGVPVALVGAAVGIATAVSELLGATVMPVIGGALADMFGLQAPMYLAAAGPLIAILVCLLYHETAPAVLARRSQNVAA